MDYCFGVHMGSSENIWVISYSNKQLSSEPRMDGDLYGEGCPACQARYFIKPIR